MSIPNQEHVMINHIIKRRNTHLAKLSSSESTFSEMRVWEKFYKRLLSKYNNSFSEVKYYD